MKKICTLSLCIIFMACNNSGNSKKSLIKATESISKAEEKKIIKPKHDITLDLKTMIRGRWCALKDTESALSIDTNEIFYYDASIFCKYSLSNDRIQISFPEYTYKAHIKLKGKDTLIMEGLEKFKDDNDTLHRGI